MNVSSNDTDQIEAIYLYCNLDDMKRIHLLIEACKSVLENPDTAEVYPDFGYKRGKHSALFKLLDDIEDGKISRVVTFTPDHLAPKANCYVELENFFSAYEVYYDFVREEKYNRVDTDCDHASSKKYLAYNYENGRYGIRREKDWVNPGLYCNDQITININGKWVPTQIALTADGWYLKGTGFRGNDLKNIEVR